MDRENVLTEDFVDWVVPHCMSERRRRRRVIVSCDLNLDFSTVSDCSLIFLYVRIPQRKKSTGRFKSLPGIYWVSWKLKCLWTAAAAGMSKAPPPPSFLCQLTKCTSIRFSPPLVLQCNKQKQWVNRFGCCACWLQLTFYGLSLILVVVQVQ